MQGRRKNWSFFSHLLLYFSQKESFFLPNEQTIETKMKRPSSMNWWTLRLRDANTILAPIGRSTWLCTITNNNSRCEEKNEKEINGHTDFTGPICIHCNCNLYHHHRKWWSLYALNSTSSCNTPVYWIVEQDSFFLSLLVERDRK